MAIPLALDTRVKTILNSSWTDTLPKQPASLSLIFYLASSSYMSSLARRTHQDFPACQLINKTPSRTVNKIKLWLRLGFREVNQTCSLHLDEVTIISLSVLMQKLAVVQLMEAQQQLSSINV